MWQNSNFDDIKLRKFMTHSKSVKSFHGFSAVFNWSSSSLQSNMPLPDHTHTHGYLGINLVFAQPQIGEKLTSFISSPPLKSHGPRGLIMCYTPIICPVPVPFTACAETTLCHITGGRPTLQCPPARRNRLVEAMSGQAAAPGFIPAAAVWCANWQTAAEWVWQWCSDKRRFSAAF